MNMLVAMESPIRLVEMLPAETKSTLLLPQASAMSCSRSLPGSCQFGLRTKSAVGAVYGRGCRLGQGGKIVGRLCRARVAFFQRTALDRDEAGAKALDAGII